MIMHIISFESDYIEGAHENIIRRLVETNLEQTPGYGLDHYSESAKQKIRESFGCPDADVFLLVGGTQTNSTVIASMLHDYEGVVSAGTGHIGVHESGAVEYTGHKVLVLEVTAGADGRHVDGKIDAGSLKAYLDGFFSNDNRDHMVFPGMVYISFPTELGTLYSKRELEAIHEVCLARHLPLFIDGARLGYGLMSPDNDIAPGDLADLCEVFYIGGTKVGALFGEAVVFPHHGAPSHFFTTVKQHGALLAKGRLLGLQFETLFTDGLYFEISRHAIDMAELMKGIFRQKGYSFYIDSPTNQQFVLMDNSAVPKLMESVRFEVWGPFDSTRSIVRFVTGWATKEENVLALRRLLPDDFNLENDIRLIAGDDTLGRDLQDAELNKCRREKY